MSVLLCKMLEEYIRTKEKEENKSRVLCISIFFKIHILPNIIGKVNKTTLLKIGEVLFPLRKSLMITVLKSIDHNSPEFEYRPGQLIRLICKNGLENMARMYFSQIHRMQQPENQVICMQNAIWSGRLHMVKYLFVEWRWDKREILKHKLLVYAEQYGKQDILDWFNEKARDVKE